MKAETQKIMNEMVEGGKDGVGNPFYVAPLKAVPAVTHTAPATLQ